jgi:uncharacterized glyoxalase superfamily protein PhnB
MAMPQTTEIPTLYPGLSCRDAPAAIAWLRGAFGFEELLVVPGPDGTIAHAELKFGNDYGGQGYAARDLEGNEWYFGSYRPAL